MAPYKPKYIFGMHDPGGEYLMSQAGKKGWVLFVHALGHDPVRATGFDYTPQSNQGFGIMARLNHGYEPHGTIPASSQHADFAATCARWVQNSRGCHIWIIGNEMNYAVERPGIRYDHSKTPPAILDPGEIITPQVYARCYRLCRDAIHRVPGHAQDEVLVGAIAPWNAQTTYPGNPSGDWIQYFRDLLTLLGPDQCDGITVHSYTHGTSPQLVHSEARFSAPPFDKYYYNFLAYRDFVQAIPRSMRHLPVYITETDQDEAWRNENTGWVQLVYGEIDWWNRQPGSQQIHCLLLYRWPTGFDRWGIEGKAGVIEDFKAALRHEAVWQEHPTPIVYRVAWLRHDIPSTVEAGGTLEVALQLRNDGNAPWKRTGYREVQVGFHWHRDGKDVTLDRRTEVRTKLPADVEPGSRTSLTAQAGVPEDPGEYTLSCDLVEEGVAWFANEGSSLLSMPISVEPPPPKEEFVEATGHWVRGAFLEFYRAHGLDITGYPISEQYVHPITGLPTQDFQKVVMEEMDGLARLRPAGQLLKEAGERIALLSSQIEELRQQLVKAGFLPPPQVEDVTDLLPREDDQFVRREPSDVRYVVIHHSGLTKDIGLERIATAHQRRGWPGITYQYYIDRQGQIFRTNPDDHSVSAEDRWAMQGINVCFAGHFSQEVPSENQMASGVRLCAWLLREYSLAEEALVGVNYFHTTESPGSNWTSGANWRATLLNGIEELWSAVDGAGDDRSQQISSLRAQVQDLERQLETLVQENAALKDEIGRLRKQLEVEPLPPPEIEDVSDSLPRVPDEYIQRQTQTIRHLVIHESGTPPSVDIKRIAETHKERGWPGTLYHYFVDSQGTILQTGSVEQIVSDSARWLVEGVNVCFAGDFAHIPPSDDQVESGAHLCAWLLQALSLPTDAIVGARDLYDTESPGMQWDEGVRWKTRLLTRTEALLAAHTLPGDDTQSLRSLIERLQASLDASENAANALEQERDQLKTAVLRLEAEIEQLEASVADRDALERETRALELQLQQAQERIAELEAKLDRPLGDQLVVAKPVIDDIVDDLPKHEELEYETRSLDGITHLCIHHSAASASVHPSKIAEYHIKEDSSRNKPAWPGIGYHYYISPDGTIYQTNRHETLSYHCGGNNEYTLGICFAGSFMEVIPTPRQLQRGGHLLAWLLQQLDIPADHVWGHQEFPRNRTTQCPGAQWLEGQGWKDALQAEMQAVRFGLPSPLDKPITHYLLFWWRSPGHWARGDWLNAQAYIARYHPVCGFSEEAARNSRYVLIVGGTAGVSWQTEEDLRRAGCKVERVAGVDEADTKHQLNELANSGKPFRSFEIADPWWE